MSANIFVNTRILIGKVENRKSTGSLINFKLSSDNLDILKSFLFLGAKIKNGSGCESRKRTAHSKINCRTTKMRMRSPLVFPMVLH